MLSSQFEVEAACKARQQRSHLGCSGDSSDSANNSVTPCCDSSELHRAAPQSHIDTVELDIDRCTEKFSRHIDGWEGMLSHSTA